MSFYNLFPRTGADYVRRSLVLCAVSLAITAFSAREAFSQSSSRPVARLVSSATFGAPLPVSARARIVPVSAVRPAPVAASPMVASMERRAFDLINAQRRANGRPPLVFDEELCQMARIHSEKMARYNFFQHVGPDGMDTADRAHALGIVGWRALGENIAYNQGYQDPAGFAVERWMLSDKHRSNALNAGFTRSGVGVARGADGSFFFTQVFITR